MMPADDRELQALDERTRARELEQDLLALQAELQQRDVTIAQLTETTFRLRVRLERILSSPPARLYTQLLRLPGLDRLQQRRLRSYSDELARRRPGSPHARSRGRSRARDVGPPVLRDTRRELAEEFLHGDGIEIGALHLPIAVPEGTQVRYVDRMTVEALREHYAELAQLDLVPVDVVDDGERLDTFAPDSLDFIVANHFLEHCEDPIRTIETHLSKLRPGGVLFYAVPDKRYTFDVRRPSTPLRHAVLDYEHGPEASRHGHYLEWQRLVIQPHADPDDPDLIARAEALEADRYSIHFHVWAQADFIELMLHCQERFGTFEIEAIRHRALENIVVLRRHGAPPASVLPPPEYVLDATHRTT